MEKNIKRHSLNDLAAEIGRVRQEWEAFVGPIIIQGMVKRGVREPQTANQSVMTQGEKSNG